MQTTGYIFLEELRFFAYHGVAPQENAVGNEFVVNLRFKTDLTRAVATDNVADTVNYADVYEAVKNEMEQTAQLLEHVCGRIVKRLFREFPDIEEIDITLSKRTPPMGADIKTAGVEMHCTRE